MTNLEDEEEIPKNYTGIQNTEEWKQERKDKLRKDWIIGIVIVVFFFLFTTFCTSPSRCNPDIDDCYGNLRRR